MFLRYTDAKDTVLVTAGEKDELAELVLNSGRIYAAFVSDSNKVDGVRGRLDTACDTAVKQGLFVASMARAPVVIGAGSLPVNVPESSMGSPSKSKLADLVEEGDGSISLAEHQRAVANGSAKDFGLEIKVSSHEL